MSVNGKRKQSEDITGIHGMLLRFRKRLACRWFRTFLFRWCMLVVAVVILSTVVFSVLFPKQVNAGEDREAYFKYYKSITVMRGDTLWEYAETYPHPNVSTKDYIREIEFINNMEAGELVAGKSITIPYYSKEYICSTYTEEP